MGTMGLRMASGRGLSEIVLAQLGALNFFVWAVANSMSSTQLRTYTGIEYILYMYNLGTAPNVQNWPGFAVCTPSPAVSPSVLPTVLLISTRSRIHTFIQYTMQCCTYSRLKTDESLSVLSVARSPVEC